MTMGSRLALVITMFAALIVGDTSSAQSTTASDPLRQQLERRFDVLPLRDGIALHPKTPRRGVRSIEISADTISIDGVPATGAELRQKLGPDAAARPRSDPRHSPGRDRRAGQGSDAHPGRPRALHRLGH